MSDFELPFKSPMAGIIEPNLYFDATVGRGPNPFYNRIEDVLPKHGVAIDLGCGTGAIAVALAARGMHVIAVDVDPTAIRLTQELAASKGVEIEAKVADLASYEPLSFDVALSIFTLFFLGESELLGLIRRLSDSAAPGAIVAGQLLGPNDDWIKAGCFGCDRQWIGRAFDSFETIFVDEAERDGSTVTGEPKHWHVFHFAFRKV